MTSGELYLPLKDVPDINDLRSAQKWDSLTKKHYADLEYLDIEENPLAVKRRRPVSPDKEGADVCYFDDDGRPVRIDTPGACPAETYLVWENDRPACAYSFYLGYLEEKKVSGIVPAEAWTYHYDEDRLMELRVISYKHPQFRYFSSGGKRSIRFVYDAKGLAKKYQTVTGTRGIIGEFLIFDRERERLLAEGTVSRTPYISRTGGRPSSEPSPFSLDHYQSEAHLLAPRCAGCKRIMSYHGYVDTTHSKIAKKPPLSRVPLFCCLECFQGASVNLETGAGLERVSRHDVVTFPKKHLDFRKASTAEEQDEALVKIGGTPDWIQDEEHPKCPGCGKVMLFVCQVNSDEEKASDGQVRMFGDMGKLYAFSCCKWVTTLMQFT